MLWYAIQVPVSSETQLTENGRDGCGGCGGVTGRDGLPGPPRATGIKEIDRKENMAKGKHTDLLDQGDLKD